MREKEGDTRLKGEEWRGKASERAAVSSSSSSQTTRRLLLTGSDYSLPDGNGTNGAVQHSTRCAAHPLRAGYRGTNAEHIENKVDPSRRLQQYDHTGGTFSYRTASYQIYIC